MIIDMPYDILDLSKQVLLPPSLSFLTIQ